MHRTNGQPDSLVGHRDAAPAPPGAAGRRAVRTIAGFEAFKGVVALAACLGFLSLLHRDLHHVATSLIGHIGLDPGGHYPDMVLDHVDRLLSVRPGSLVLAAAAYIGVRFTEAYGLWNERSWADGLGALSGALYIPFEARHLLHKPTVVTAVVILVNLAVVAFLAWRLRQRRRLAN